MGKYGAFELNYSSDIDLIVFYDLARIRLRAGLEVQTFLRAPDARPRPPAARAHRRRLRVPHRSAPAARSRRHAAGALDRGRAQLLRELRPELGARRPHQGARRWPATSPRATPSCSELAPYIWRKYLDFAAIADIHAMKRQIHAFRGFGNIGVAGHNIKVGRGGIREIEFFVQTQQLIAGGRQPELRVSETLLALDRLEERGWITRSARARSWIDAYRFLRTRRASPADDRRRADPDAARRSRQARRRSPASAALPTPPPSPRG